MSILVRHFGSSCAPADIHITLVQLMTAENDVQSKAKFTGAKKAQPTWAMCMREVCLLMFLAKDSATAEWTTSNMKQLDFMLNNCVR